MKHLLIFFILLFATLSCSRNDDDFPENPGWLNDRIAQMELNAIPGTEVIAYQWMDGYYYHIMNPVSSCLLCDVYDYSGNKIVWTDEDFIDFHTHGKMVKVVWRKK